MTRFQAFSYGLVLSAVAFLASLTAALWGFRRMYYLAAILPAFMVFYILLAWLIYLKKSSFRGFDARTSRSGTDLPEDKISGTELVGNRDQNGLLPRRPDLQDNRVEAFLSNPVPALLWSACQLAILATVLYNAFGIGASYY